MKIQVSDISLTPAYFESKTKKLLQWIPEHSIAVIDHQDIDEMAAMTMIQKKVKAVLNCSQSMSGQFPSQGTKVLCNANIPVFDIKQPEQLFSHFHQGEIVRIDQKGLWVNKNGDLIFVSKLTNYTEKYIQYKHMLANRNLNESLRTFTQNTLYYAIKERNEILKPLPLPPLRCKMKGRHVVVVTRGNGYIEDLKAIHGYIKEKRPLFIGVDGGADAIMECGYKPDMILGDMDSVSREALFSGAEMIVHGYTNGEAPGLNEIQKYGLSAHVFSCFGTSEDAAHLLAYEAGALLIVTLGSHTNMLDFLEKGRKGMGSTLLVRLKIGEKLVDAKGVRLLYPYRHLESEEERCLISPHPLV